MADQPIATRPSSEIRRCQHNGKTVYEKRYVTNDWDSDPALIVRRAWQESRLLNLLAEGTRFRRRLGVVRVAQIDPDEATISTFEVPGQSLEEWIRGSQTDKSLCLPWYLAGRWLREFQKLPFPDDFPPSQPSATDPDDLVEYCDLRLRTLADYGYSWPNDQTRQRFLAAIDGLDSAVPASDRRPVWAHADYSPGNLMWGDGTLTPIDFAMARPGFPLDDATYLIHRLEMHRVYRPWLRLPVQKWTMAILRGLGHPGALQSPAYRVAMIKHLICRLHTYARRPAKNAKQALHDRWVRAIVRRKLINELNSTSASDPSGDVPRSDDS